MEFQELPFVAVEVAVGTEADSFEEEGWSSVVVESVLVVVVQEVVGKELGRSSMGEKVNHSHLDSKVGTVIVKKGGMSFPSMDNAAANFHAQDG